jgi:hypothetical protein
MAGPKTDGNGNATGVWAKTVSANGNPSYSHAHTDTDVTLPPTADLSNEPMTAETIANYATSKHVARRENTAQYTNSPELLDRMADDAELTVVLRVAQNPATSLATQARLYDRNEHGSLRNAVIANPLFSPELRARAISGEDWTNEDLAQVILRPDVTPAEISLAANTYEGTVCSIELLEGAAYSLLLNARDAAAVSNSENPIVLELLAANPVIPESVAWKLRKSTDRDVSLAARANLSIRLNPPLTREAALALAQTARDAQHKLEISITSSSEEVVQEQARQSAEYRVYRGWARALS